MRCLKALLRGPRRQPVSSVVAVWRDVNALAAGDGNNVELDVDVPAQPMVTHELVDRDTLVECLHDLGILTSKMANFKDNGK